MTKPEIDTYNCHSHCLGIGNVRVMFLYTVQQVGSMNCTDVEFHSLLSV